jgi:two-component system, cell cycle sensor histidine kinase PleC
MQQRMMQPELPGDVGEGDGWASTADSRLAAQLARVRVELAERTRQLKVSEQTNQSRSAFLASMSHDLRTPLTAIIGYTDLLVMGVPERMPNATHAHVQRIRTSARQMLSLVDELLACARAERGGAPEQRESGSQGDPGEVAR